MPELDERVTAALHALVNRLETQLPPAVGLMVWFYSRNTPDLEVSAFSSHEDDGETIRILRTVLRRLMSKESAVDERWFDAAFPGLPMTAAALARAGNHDRLRLWNRGALAGELILEADDGELMATALGLKERKRDDA
jgi:hypothetical protein